MKYKNLGATKCKVPVIGQGCMGIGGYFSRNSSHDDVHVANLKSGIELGMNFIDTAPVYGKGHSEEIVGKALHNLRKKVILATKVAPEDLTCDRVADSVERSLARLSTDYIDLFQIHWPNPKIPISDTMGACRELVKEGKIRYVGVCNFSKREMEQARESLPGDLLVSVQVEYNLFDRTIENSILPYCEEKNITTIAYSPLDQGKTVGGQNRRTVLRNIAEKYKMTEAQVALNWLVAHSGVIAIPKASSLTHIKENAASVDFELSREDRDEIDFAFQLRIISVAPGRIRVVPDAQGERSVYCNLHEALENKLGFVPSPSDLAENIRLGEVLKPVRVVRAKTAGGAYDYDLVEGRIRYWAWVIAYEGKRSIPVLLREQ
jgi:aryl-alcohol dehydrogenase-like predicted oxidoreductase